MLRREDGHVLRALSFEVESQRKKGGHETSRLRKKA